MVIAVVEYRGAYRKSLKIEFPPRPTLSQEIIPELQNMLQKMENMHNSFTKIGELESQITKIQV